MVDIRLITYGVKYKSTPAADLYFDCQVFTDPISHADFYEKDGRDKGVQNFLLSVIKQNKRQRRSFDNIVKVLSAIAEDHKHDRESGLDLEPMLVALFCFGGRHRSVGVSEIVKCQLEEKGILVELTHLDRLRRNQHKHGKIYEIRTASEGKASHKN